MAQKIMTVFSDDLTGAESKDVQTHTFSLDGVNYEIDLTSDNYDKLYEALAPFIDSGRKTGRTRTATQPRKQATSGPSAEEVRSWARENGHQVSDRGRVPASVREAYERAH
ncbi:Lsr2 family protein [Streptomyces sp. NPDC002952]|uniref:histone-like nucleoid-structuring protein Lsr2 n=1 Tax=Streptomyces sp. NPDC002952 TaxID=3364673 RepID=UPI00369D4067